MLKHNRVVLMSVLLGALFSVPDIGATCTSSMKAMIVEGGGVGQTSTASACLNHLGYNTIHVYTQPSVSMVKGVTNAHEVFIFNGHANGSGCMVINDTLGYVLCPSDVSSGTGPTECSKDYKLIFANACALYGYASTWKSAMNADCFVSWTGNVEDEDAIDFDELMWAEDEEGADYI